LTDWIKLAAISLLISIAITGIVATAVFAVWWGSFDSSIKRGLSVLVGYLAARLGHLGAHFEHHPLNGAAGRVAGRTATGNSGTTSATRWS
jgi:hypothetical protein